MGKIFFVLTSSFLVLSQLFAQPITKTFNIAGFSKLDVSNAFDVELQRGNEEKVVIECEEDMLNNIQVSVKSNQLVIRLKSGTYNQSGKNKATVYYKSLDEIDASGAVSLKTLNILEAKTLDIDLSGASSGRLDVQCSSLQVDLSGASSLTLAGKINSQNVEISGASSYKSFELESDVCNLETSGASSAQVFVKNEITGEASGASSIRYKGDPKRVIVDASGSSSVKNSK